MGAINQIHHELLSMRDNGHAILLVSSDLDEIFTLLTGFGCLKANCQKAFTKESQEKSFTFKDLDLYNSLLKWILVGASVWVTH